MPSEASGERPFGSNGEAVERSQSATEWRRQLKIYFYETGNATCVTTTSGRMMVHTHTSCNHGYRRISAILCRQQAAAPAVAAARERERGVFH